MRRDCQVRSYHQRHEPCSGLEAPALRRLECGPDRPVRDACRARRARPRRRVQPGRRARPDLRGTIGAGGVQRFARLRACPRSGSPAAGDPGRRARRRFVASGDQACRHGLGARPRRRGSGVLARAGSDRRCDWRRRADREWWKRCAGAVSARPGRAGSHPSSPPPSPQPQPQPQPRPTPVDRIVNTVTPVTQQLPAPVGLAATQAVQAAGSAADGVLPPGWDPARRVSRLRVSSFDEAVAARAERTRGAARRMRRWAHRERRPDGGPHAGHARQDQDPRRGRLAALQRRCAAQRRLHERHRPERAQRRRAAPAQGEPPRDRRLLGDRAARGDRRGRHSARRAGHDDDLRADARARCGQRPRCCGSSRPATSTRTRAAPRSRRPPRSPIPTGGSSTRLARTAASTSCAVASGREVRSGGWPRRVTLDPTHEKIASALNISGGSLLVTTGGYIGDAPPYQGHVVTIDRATGRITAVWNSLCSDRHHLIVPSTCSASDSAIWGRAGAVVEPGTGRILVATGNAPFNGSTELGRQRARAQRRRPHAAAQLDARQPGSAERRATPTSAALRRRCCPSSTASGWRSRAARTASCAC